MKGTNEVFMHPSEEEVFHLFAKDKTSFSCAGLLNQIYNALKNSSQKHSYRIEYKKY